MFGSSGNSFKNVKNGSKSANTVAESLKLICNVEDTKIFSKPKKTALEESYRIAKIRLKC